MSKLEEMQKAMSEAVEIFKTTGDMSKIQEVSNAMNKAKTEIAKAEADRLLKESEALAGKREALANAINTAVKALNLDSQLASVKSKGFSYTINHMEDDKGRIDANGTVKVLGGVGLLVTAIKTRKAGNGNGGGKSKEEYGISLSEIVSKFATPEEQLAIANAETNSKSWQLKVVVKKRAIAEGKLPPVK